MTANCLVTLLLRLQNPFPYLIRDADVEGMSDGFDNATAYGACLSIMLKCSFCPCAGMGRLLTKSAMHRPRVIALQIHPLSDSHCT